MGTRMDNFNDTPLAVEDGEKVTATVVSWNEHPPKGGGFSIPACSYGVTLMIDGQIVRQLWGAGYAPEPIPTIAHAVGRVLTIVPATSPILVEALADFGRYWGAEGYVANRQSGRTTASRKLALWPLMQDLQTAQQRGRWRFTPLPKEMLGFAFLEANEVARGLARQKALEHKAATEPTSLTYSRGVAFLQGGTV
jgi:hypothetical protein